MENTALPAAFAAWQQGRAFSRHTIQRRRTSISLFARYIDPADLGDATPELIEEWIATLRAPRTRHAYRSDLAAFYSWAVRRRLLDTNPVTQTDAVRIPRSLPRPVNPRRIPGILAAASDPDTRLMIALAAYAGLRCAEIAAVQTGDVSLDPPLLNVRDGKGGKDRTIPLHPVLVPMLAIRRVDGPLFHLSPPSVGRRIARHLAACGIDATAHKLRHTFGTELARVSGGNMTLVAHLMGHESMSTTAGYVALTGNGYDAVALMFGPATSG